MSSTSAITRQNLAAQQRSYALSKPANATPPRTLVNSTTTGLYTGNAMGSTRPGAGELRK